MGVQRHFQKYFIYSYHRYSEEPAMETQLNRFDLVGLWCWTPLSTILQLYRGGLEETGVPGENQRPAASQWQTLPHTTWLWTQ